MKKPRRAGLRWREDAPEYVVDCFDIPNTCDRWTVLLWDKGMCEGWLSILSMSDAPEHPQGVSMMSEIEDYHARGFRYRNGHRRVRWLDLPAHIREHVASRWVE